jgi:hypothetical protein
MYFLRQLSHDEMERKVHTAACVTSCRRSGSRELRKAASAAGSQVSQASRQPHADFLQLKGDLDEEVKFDPLKYNTPALAPSPELQTRHKAAAKVFDDMWRTGDPAAARQILAEDVSIVSVLLSMLRLACCMGCVAPWCHQDP